MPRNNDIMANMIIMGIDPGFAITGYGVIKYEGNRFTVIDYGVIRTDAGIPLPKRLHILGTEVGNLLSMYKPDAVAVEELFFNTNLKTAISVAQSRGVVLYEVMKCGLPVFEYTPLQVKVAVTGYGRADKAQMQQMIKIILNLNSIPKPDDAADALAVSVCHVHSGTGICCSKR
jgi:crossover junction endodeoxyribonuclease RuvC